MNTLQVLIIYLKYESNDETSECDQFRMHYFGEDINSKESDYVILDPLGLFDDLMMMV